MSTGGGGAMAKKSTLVSAESFQVHEYLQEELQSRDLSVEDFAKLIDATPQRAQEIFEGKRPIGPTVSRLLGEAWGMSPEFWLRLQTQYASWPINRKVR